MRRRIEFDRRSRKHARRNRGNNVADDGICGDERHAELQGDSEQRQREQRRHLVALLRGGERMRIALRDDERFGNTHHVYGSNCAAKSGHGDANRYISDGRYEVGIRDDHDYVRILGQHYQCDDFAEGDGARTESVAGADCNRNK